MLFLRIIVFLIFGMFLLSVLKAVLRLIGLFFSAAFQPQGPSPSTPPMSPRPALPATGELKRDPVCGRYILAESALKKKVKGEIEYFCSQECLGKYPA